jgi:hypothetical protein
MLIQQKYIVHIPKAITVINANNEIGQGDFAKILNVVYIINTNDDGHLLCGISRIDLVGSI